MTTIDQIKKHYDKLNDRERFALLAAARDRDDNAEIDALLASAPRKAWNVKTVYGLSEGFQFTGMWYMMEQLGYMATIYFMFENSNPSSQGAKYYDFVYEGKETSINLDEFGDEVIKRILTNYLAWMRLCDEYKIDLEGALKNYPHYDMMQLLLLIIDGAAGMMGEDAQPGEEEINDELETMRAVIDHFVTDWE